MKTILFFILIFSLKSISQNQYLDSSNKYISLGEYRMALKFLDSAEIFSSDPKIIYDKAIIYYRLKEFPKTIELLDKLILQQNKIPEYYHLLAASHDLNGDRSQALNTLNAGLKLFPNSGRIYYELGIIDMTMNQRDDAKINWEKGIMAEPTYPNNYYQLAKYFNENKFLPYSIIYSEIFLNLAADEEKKVEISKLLYNNYLKLSNLDFTILDEMKENPFLLNFMSLILNSKTDSIKNIAQVIEFRKSIIKNMHIQNYNEIYPNALFNYFEKLNNSNNFETYSNLIFNSVDSNYFVTWAGNNSQNIQIFMNWVSKNPLFLTKDNIFVTITDK